MEGLKEIAKNPSSFVHSMPFGAELQPDGKVRFRVWAPEAEALHLDLESLAEDLPMHADEAGWFALTTDQAGAQSRYRFVLPNGLRVPDPVSRFQPDDVNGPSAVMDPTAYAWRVPDWRGRPWEEAVIYELHIGTFTPEGTFTAAEGRLAHLAELGVTAIEIMSLGEFPGRWNWGYDGVLPYAPDSNYGTPDELKSLVDRAHQAGIMVLLDVVYNHFGPEGNYIPQYFPDICTDRYQTPWGQALNFDAQHGDQTREFIIHNALYWIEEFRMDGLRLDAVHAIIDSSSTHVLDELAQRVRQVAGDRLVHLVLESDDTMWPRLIRDQAAAPLLSTAQWNHDSKQLLVLGLTSEQDRERDQDLRDTDLLGRALVEGFTSQPPSGLTREEAEGSQQPKFIPPGGFVAFLQTHDLVGNRIRGERIGQLGQASALRAVAAIYLLSPQIPMLFMGEEWSASTPFPFFCDFQGDLADAVRKGRLAQFTSDRERADQAYLSTLPDPLAESTFLSAKLKWDELKEPPHAAWLSFYRSVLRVRREQIVPLLLDCPTSVGSYEVPGARLLRVRWRMKQGTLQLDANLSSQLSPPMTAPTGQLIWFEGPQPHSAGLPPWSVRWTYTAD